VNLKNISDMELDRKLVNLAAQERELLTRVLHHLREVENRRLFSALGYKSLFDYTVRRFLADESLLKKLEQLKGLLAHSHADASTGELLHKVCDIAIQRLCPSERKARVPGSREKVSKAAIFDAPVPAAPQKHRGKTPAGKSPHIWPRPHIPSHIQKEVWQRANCQCQNCGSQRALQIDHIIPVAKGGGSTPDNLRLLCRSCNQRAAIEQFGLRKMQAYVRSPVRIYQKDLERFT